MVIPPRAIIRQSALIYTPFPIFTRSKHTPLSGAITKLPSPRLLPKSTRRISIYRSVIGMVWFSSNTSSALRFALSISSGVLMRVSTRTSMHSIDCSSSILFSCGSIFSFTPPNTSRSIHRCLRTWVLRKTGTDVSRSSGSGHPPPGLAGQLIRISHLRPAYTSKKDTRPRTE